jgi:hypothetical protein
MEIIHFVVIETIPKHPLSLEPLNKLNMLLTQWAPCMTFEAHSCRKSESLPSESYSWLLPISNIFVAERWGSNLWWQMPFLRVRNSLKGFTAMRVGMGIISYEG